MSIPRLLLVVVAVLGLPALASAGVRIAAQDSGVDVRLRGISAVDADIAWASGRKGTVLRTLDGGRHWQAVPVPGGDELDFRDIEAFDATTAVVLSIGPGEASRVYRTEDGGGTWQLALQNRDPRAFFDCIAFEGQRGWMLGDPVDGHFQVYATDNGGRDWRLLDDGPLATEGEAAFAASGTCIARLEGALLVATGGSAARLHMRADGDSVWQAVDSGMGRGKPEAGVFSIATKGDHVFAVGGDYKAETAPGNAATWQDPRRVETLPAPRGYRSGVACVQDDATCIAVGPSGVDAWNGKAWRKVSDTGYDAIAMAGGVGWASGDAGRIARIELAPEDGAVNVDPDNGGRVEGRRDSRTDRND